GVIGTPVIDRTGGTIYVVAASKDTSGSVPAFHQRLHALNIADGSEELNGPTEISATLPGSGDGGTSVSFDPLLENQRAALLLAPTPGVGSGNSVFIAWGSHGDHGSYHGWIMAYDAANIALQNGVWLSTPNGIGGGVWMSGGGPSSDGRGNIFAASGNGTFDADASGSDYGDSAFRLLFSGSGLQLADYFTPADESSLNTGDHDMGMSAPIVLPTEVGPIPHLTMTTDKNGTLYLLNRDNMGEFGTPDDDSVQSISTGYHIHSSAAFFNNVLYLGLDNGPLQAWKLDTATDQLVPQSATSTVFITPAYSGGGGTPSISSNGTSQRIAWIIQDTDFNVGPAILHAYNAANLSQELYNSAQAANSRDAAAIAVKFTTPTIANGRVYVGGRNAVTVYGLLSTSSPCTAPSGGGINVCSPAENSTVTSPVAVEAAASISGDIYRFSLWNNSTKLLDERNTGIMDDSVTLAPGSYTLTFVASNTAGVHEYTTRDITVSGGACAAPSSDGVNVCSPSGGATVGSAFTVQASATVTGGVYRFELWANGTKVYTVRDSGIMEATISLEPGSYSLDFIARNTAGEHVSKTISVTVQ
ncbi:MAG TPA: Ig-like domain-containing protein, partial [Terracidiphilus sp.]